MNDRREKILARMREHLDVGTKLGYEIVGIFLQGSQNYDLDTEMSDIDTKVIVLPKFEDFVLNKQPISYTHVMENEEHVDFKDIRLMFDCFKKQNINFVEILFTEFRILNPKYKEIYKRLLAEAERIAHYNNYASLNCMVGMALEKQKAMEHPYPSIVHKIEQFGYDSKQLHHAIRLHEFMLRYIDGIPYADCLKTQRREYMKSVKANLYDLETAREHMSRVIEAMKSTKQQYMDSVPVAVDKGVDELLNSVLLEIMKKNFVTELGLPS